MSRPFLDIAEFKTAWRIVLIALIGIGITANAALLYVFGTLIVPLEAAYGWSQAEVQSSVTALYLGAILGLQIAGWLNLKLGIRRSTMASLVSSALAYLLIVLVIPEAPSIWVFYILIALLPILGAGALTVTWTELIALWFVKNRGLALAIGLSGTGLAASILPPIMAFAIAEWDWRVVFVILALLNVGLALPLAFFWVYEPDQSSAPHEEIESDPQAQIKSGWTYRRALRSRQLWTLNLALSLVVLAVISMVTSTVPLLQNRGFEPLQAASIFSAFGAALIFGRVAVGFLLDRLWPALVAGLTMLLPALGCALILSGDTNTSILVPGAFLIGFGAGAEFDIAAFLVARYFGLRDYGRLFGLHLGLVTAAAAIAPLLVANVLNYTNDYAAVITYSLCCFTAGGMLLLTLGRAPQTLKNVESPRTSP